MASKFCAQCGMEITEGKKFCRGCGKPLSQPTTAVEESISVKEADARAAVLRPTPPIGPETEALGSVLPERVAIEAAIELPPVKPVQAVVDANLGPRLCTQCGQPLVAGKRFCGKCGQPVAAVAPSETPAPSSDSRSLYDAAVPSQTAAPAPTASNEFSSAPPTLFDQPTATSPAWEPETPASVAFMPNPDSERIGTSWTARLRSISWHNASMLAGGCILVIVTAAIGLWLHHRHTIVGAGASNLVIAGSAAPKSSEPVFATRTANPALAAPPAITSGGTSEKPSAGKASETSQQVSPDRVQDQATASDRSLPTVVRPPVTQAHLEVPRNSAAFSQDSSHPNSAPPLAKIPEPPRNGVLHYNGPPVPYGGTVAFHNLSGGRLRFVFDHTSWQALISRQPDGTQTLTLRSIRHADQAQCDVQWEAVQ